MHSHSHQFRLFPLRRVIPRRIRKFLSSMSFATGVLVLGLMLIMFISVVLLAPVWEDIAR